MSEWSEYWWTSITGPKNLCDAVSSALCRKKSVCLIVPDDLPWRDEMRANMEMNMRQIPDMESFYVEYIDVEDDCPDVCNIGHYLLERYASPEIASGYRRGTIQKYILDMHVLDHRILWIKGMNAEQEKRWLSFCRNYVPAKETDGRFVLEMKWTDRELERGNLAVIRYIDIIKRYDLTLFNSIYLNREKSTYSAIWQQYAAILCALLCDTDAETAHALMQRCDFATEEPIVGMQSIAEDGMYLRRGESNAQHILSLVRKNDTAAIEKQIWKAQLQVLFPLLEMERVSFVNQYREPIREALIQRYYDFKTERSQQIYQFGEEISEPEDAELGTIYRMTKLRREEDLTQYMLYIPDEAARTRIDLLHDLRNALAHGVCCAIDRVAEFINAHPFHWER